jgi:hypothetical protein
MTEALRIAMAMAAEKVEAGTAVKHAVGFAPSFEYVAEATVQAQDGFVTTREGGHTEDGALARARSAANARVTARKRCCGFVADGFRTEGTRAAFGFGFAN